MKRFVSLFLTVVLLLTVMIGCNNPSDKSSESTTISSRNTTDTTTNEIISNNSIEEKQITQEVSNSDGRTPKNEQESQIEVTFETYDSIIKTYKKMVEIAPNVIEEKEIFNETVKRIFNVEETKKEWFSQLTTSIAASYPKDIDGIIDNGYADFGYAEKDINGDGSDELLLMLSDGTIIAIFTNCNNVPMLLDTFQNRYRCSLNSVGDIFTSGSNGAVKTVNRRYTIDSSTKDMVLVCEYGTDGFDNITGETIFYVSINSEKDYLTEPEYDEFCKSNNVMNSSQLLEFLTYKQLFE